MTGLTIAEDLDKLCEVRFLIVLFSLLYELPGCVSVGGTGERDRVILRPSLPPSCHPDARGKMMMMVTKDLKL